MKKISKEPINRLGNKGSLGPTVKWTETGRCVFPSEDSKKSLNRRGNEKCETLLPYRGKERHTEMNTDNNRIVSEKYKKSIIRYNTVKVTGSPQEMKVTPYGKGDYRLSEGKGSEESTNHTRQMEYKQGLKEDSKTMTITLCGVQCRNSKNSINQPKGMDEKELDQMVTPVHIPTCTCYQTDSNNDVAKKTEEFNKVDLQQGWGKTVSFN